MRKRNVMVEICQNLNNEEKNGTPEDIIFTDKFNREFIIKHPQQKF